MSERVRETSQRRERDLQGELDTWRRARRNRKRPTRSRDARARESMRETDYSESERETYYSDVSDVDDDDRYSDTSSYRN